MDDKKTFNSAWRLAGFALGMFAFGYVLVPIYDVFCDITGLNGKTGVVNEAVAEKMHIDESREITVEFVASLNQNLNWDFAPVKTKMTVHPGEIYTTHFVATNNYDRDMVGQAIPSLQPGVAAKHFNKTECFCFNNQLFKSHESKTMPVSFVIDPKLPKKIQTVTLSYTFFDVTQSASVDVLNEKNNLITQ